MGGRDSILEALRSSALQGESWVSLEDLCRSAEIGPSEGLRTLDALCEEGVIHQAQVAGNRSFALMKPVDLELTLTQATVKIRHGTAALLGTRQLNLDGDLYEGALYKRLLDDGRIIVVYEMAFTTRICIGPQSSLEYDDGWCYPDAKQAIQAASDWNGEGDPPDGWVKQLRTGRRREGGDPSKEFIRH